MPCEGVTEGSFAEASGPRRRVGQDQQTPGDRSENTGVGVEGKGQRETKPELDGIASAPLLDRTQHGMQAKTDAESHQSLVPGPGQGQKEQHRDQRPAKGQQPHADEQDQPCGQRADDHPHPSQGLDVGIAVGREGGESVVLDGVVEEPRCVHPPLGCEPDPFEQDAFVKGCETVVME